MNTERVKLYENVKNVLANYSMSIPAFVCATGKYLNGDLTDEAWFAGQVYKYLGEHNLSIRELCSLELRKDPIYAKVFSYVGEVAFLSKGMQADPIISNFYNELPDVSALSADVTYVLNPFLDRGLKFDVGQAELNYVGMRDNAFKNHFCIGLYRLVSFAERFNSPIRVGVFTSLDMWFNPVYEKIVSYFRSNFEFKDGLVLQENSFGYEGNVLFSIWEFGTPSVLKEINYHVVSANGILGLCSFSFDRSNVNFLKYRDSLLNTLYIKCLAEKSDLYFGCTKFLATGSNYEVLCATEDVKEHLDFLVDIGFLVLLEDYFSRSYFSVQRMKEVTIKLPVQFSLDFKVALVLYLSCSRDLPGLLGVVEVLKDNLKGSALGYFDKKDANSKALFLSEMNKKVSYFLNV